MRKMTYLIGTSVDGYIADSDGALDAFYPLPDGIVEYLVAEYPQTLPTHLHDQLGVTNLGNRFDTVVMGHGTYEPGVKAGLTSPYAHLNQYVVSGGLTSPDPAVTVIADAPIEAVRQLKRQPGDGIWLAGGGRLAAALLPEIDEVIIKIYPFFLGTGTSVFHGRIAPTHLTLTDAHTLDSGVAIHTYLPK